ncbi:MAG: PilZ domain [Rhodocyclaceae bacterium]|nr:PilZ domain [Rhodocyclaceae bacterium]
MPERREHPRRGIKLRILVAVGKVILQGRAEDISAGGASLRLDEVLPEGTRIAVRFLTPHLEKFKWIDVTATVQYVILTSGNPAYRTGVKIVGADAEARSRLETLI